MQKSPRVSLRTWIWRAFVQTALIPLILVETVLIAVYLLSNASIRDAQIDYLRDTTLTDLQAAASQEASLVQSELTHITRLTSTYAALTQQALSATAPVAPAPLGITASGVRYSLADDGGAASFYSNATPAARQNLRKVTRLQGTDAFMRETVRHNPLVASIYFNSWDNYNHIYPWFDTTKQYPHDMRIPEYNFYYLADAQHNPGRQVVWTDVYLDPAGHGWMLSAIAPVWQKEFLEGVVGLDITVGKLLENIQQLSVPWGGYALLVSNDMNIMALPPAGERDFGLDELTTHSYDEAISSELFKPEDFNLLKRSDTHTLAKAIETSAEHLGIITIPFNGQQKLVAWASIPSTGWHLLTVVDEAAVFRKTNELASHFRNIGYLLIAGLVLFYLVFFAIMWSRTRILTERLSAPIGGIGAMLREIGHGNWHPARPPTHIDELDTIITDVQAMGQRLEHNATQLQRASQDAQEASLAKSQFISSMSHELRTPLNAIQGFAQLMHMEGHQHAPDEPDYLEEILIASRHLNQLVGDILDWSKLQSEQPRLEMHEIDAVAMLHECVDLVAPQVQAHGLTLQVQEADAPLSVLADQRRLRQVLLNLLSNAIKYTPHGHITLSCSQHGNRVRMAVADTGIGIAEHQQTRLFEPFQRLGQENGAIQGSGIGLSLCKEYATLMHGEMGLHSELGQGSLFWIELPSYEAARAAHSPLSPQQKMCVYHADRDAETLSEVSHTLTHTDLHQFSDGNALLAALRRQCPDLLLLSIELDTLDGRQVLSALQRDPRFDGLPVVLLSREEQLAELVALGASALLAVPIDPNELHQLVNDLNPRR